MAVKSIFLSIVSWTAAAFCVAALFNPAAVCDSPSFGGSESGKQAQTQVQYLSGIDKDHRVDITRSGHGPAAIDSGPMPQTRSSHGHIALNRDWSCPVN